MHTLESLDVYNLSQEFSDKIWSFVTTWDKFAMYGLGKQLTNAADSISANIAEGYGRFHFKENKNFCYYSRGSILETKSFLRKMKHRNLVTTEEYANLFKQLESIHIKLNAYIKYIGNRSLNTPNHE